jgi:nitrogen-specific signal transduction histidine kinase
VIGCVGISIDITELKNSQDALKIAKEQAEAASLIKSEFVANMSHDVKTPLSGIIGMAELLTYRLEGEDLEFAQTLLASGRQLLTFFDNCLEVFKQSNEVALTVEHFNLQALLDEIYELFQPAIKTKGLIFSIYYPVHVPHYIIGSRTGTYRILLNLVSNAVKFTHQGRVIVHVDLDEHLRNQPMIKFTVEDTGIGIPKNKQKIIFERFTRLIPSYKGTYEGSGLGLSIVYKFIKSLRGEIFVKSEEGKGSQFTILLPIQILPCHEQKEDHENEVTHSALSNLAPITISKWGKSRLGASINIPVKVLLVEDNLTAQRMESSLLLSMNCHVDVVDSGERALDIFEPGKYDLIFMDIGLPGLQGDGVSRCIRKIEQGSLYHTPIIALTAHTNEAINNQYLAAGIEYIISKPLSLEQAKNIIERFL